MAQGDFQLFEVAGLNIYKIFDVEQAGYNLSWVLTGYSGVGHYPIDGTESAWIWPTVRNYNEEGYMGQDWARFIPDVYVDYDDGVAEVKVRGDFEFGMGSYMGNVGVAQRSTYYCILTQWGGSELRNHKILGYIDLTSDGGTTGWDLWSAGFTISFVDNILFTVEINR